MSDNALLGCLVELTKFLGRPMPVKTILAGLPTTESKLTIELFIRAAAHIELQARLVNLPLQSKPTHFTVPIVLLLQNEEACLLTDITNYNTLRIITPVTGIVSEMPLAEIQKLYTGRAFIIEPSFRFTAQSSIAAYENNDKNWFWHAVTKLWSPYSEMLVASFLINIFALTLPLFTMNIYDKVIPNHSFETLWVLTSGIFLVFLFDLLMRSLRSYFIDQAGKNVDLQVSANILERVIGMKMVDRPSSTGAFANTIQSFEAVREFITSTTVAVLVDLPFSLLFILIIGIIGGPLVWVVVILMPLSVAFGFLIQKPLIELTKVAHRYGAEKQAILYEILNGIETVKTDCAENYMQARWEQVVNLSAKVGMKLRLLVNSSMFFSIFIQQFSTVAVVIVGVYLISQNSITTGALIACTLLSSRALAPMSQIASLLTRYHQTATSLTSLNNIMTAPVERQLGLSTLHISKLKGDIEFSDISFQYVSRSIPIVENISFKIKAGEHVGIIGRVGSGKTTLAKLMLKLIQPSQGTIYFDGIDQSHLDVGELRQNIGYVPQDITLFYGTLRENITFGAPHASDADVLRAIELSGIDEFIKPLLGSYEAPITENGRNLSGGQRRIIAIARSVLLDPPIFILDEPTHSMDNQTESYIKENLTHYLKDKTLILMTHHVSLLSLVDRVIIVDDGRIIMDGPKDQVLRALSEGKVKVAKR